MNITIIPRCALMHEADISAVRGTVSEIQFPAGTVMLDGELSIPNEVNGLVLFVHGSGSSRRSPRNQFVANVLQNAGIGTLLFDLLTKDEEARDAETGGLRFDIALLARRLISAVQATQSEPEAQDLNI